MINRYMGITYPRFLSWRIWRWAIDYLWKRYLCPKHIHLFDEVLSQEHYLICDVCELTVHIALIEAPKEGGSRASKGLYIETAAIERDENNRTHLKWLKHFNV